MKKVMIAKVMPIYSLAVKTSLRIKKPRIFEKTMETTANKAIVLPNLKLANA